MRVRWDGEYPWQLDHHERMRRGEECYDLIEELSLGKHTAYSPKDDPRIDDFEDE